MTDREQLVAMTKAALLWRRNYEMTLPFRDEVLAQQGLVGLLDNVLKNTGVELEEWERQEVLKAVMYTRGGRG